jgi:hypothetical protein
MCERREFVGIDLVLFGFLLLLNSLGNPRIASAHGSDSLATDRRRIVFRLSPREGTSAKMARTFNRGHDAPDRRQPAQLECELESDVSAHLFVK